MSSPVVTSTRMPSKMSIEEQIKAQNVTKPFEFIKAGLRGLPSGFAGSLNGLKVLDLSGNDFEQLDKEILKLSSLEVLRLDFNRLRQLPDDMPDCLPNLRELTLDGNEFSTVPACIFRMRRLMACQMERNPLSLRLASGQVIPLPKGAANLKVLRFLTQQQNAAQIGEALEGRFILAPGFEDAIGRTLVVQDQAKKEWIEKIRIATGAYSSVLRAIDARQGSRVAIKFQTIDNATDEQRIKNIMTEAETVGKFQHIHLIQYLHEPFLRITEKVTYLCQVMELCDGDLFGLVHGRHGQAPLAMAFEMARDLMAQTLEGVGYLHGHGYGHRDLKASNIVYFRTARGYHLKITDTGSAKFMVERNSSAALVGTRGYNAPEIEFREDYGTVTLSCDVFSLGIIFWEILTGSYPSEAHVRDTQTNLKIKPTDLASTHTKDPLTNRWSHPGQPDFDGIIRFTLGKQAYSKPFEAFVLNMLRFDPEARIPQAIGHDILIRLAAIRPN